MLPPRISRGIRELVHTTLAPGPAALFFGLAWLYYGVATDVLLGASTLSNLFFGSLVALPAYLVAIAAEAFLPSRWRRVTNALLGLVLLARAVISSLDFGIALVFGQRFTSGILFILAETNLTESREFMNTYADAKLLAIAAFGVAPFALRAVLRRLPALPGLPLARRLVAVALILLALVGLVRSWTNPEKGYDPGLALLRGVLEYRQEIEGYRAAIEGMQDFDLRGQVKDSSPPGPQIGVLVLGESTGRAHLGLYGYRLDTTPRLDALRDELLVFDDVISPYSHTVPVMKELLGFANREATKSWFEYPLVFDAFRAADYETWWISNQDPVGLFSNTASAVASRTDIQIYQRAPAADKRARSYDGDLLPYLERVLARDPKQRKLIVLHLMGTHGFYHQRYPKGFGRFGPAHIDVAGREFLDVDRRRHIAQYDNAVRYGDHVLAEVIERVRRTEASAWVLYLSDHGEEVYDLRDFIGHTEAVGNRFMVEIPFLLWLSEGYRERHSERVAALRANQKQPHMTDDLIHTLLELGSLDVPGFEATRSLASRQYDSGRQRVYAGRDYDEELRHDDTRQLIRENFEKIWAHRVNSVEKLKTTRGVFSGVELDLVFDNEAGPRLDVNHPPAPSVGLSLDGYLGSLESPGDLRYWLDIKNLSPENAEPLRRHLESLAARHGLDRARVIVESSHPELLAPLSDAGWFTAFYLPLIHAQDRTPEQLGERARSLAEAARRGRVRAISFPGPMLDFARTHLLPLLEETALLTWFPARRINRWEDAVFLQEVVDDERVSVVLVGYPTRWER